MIVKLLESDIAPEVERFVLRHPEAKICHHPLWTRIVEDLGLKSYYLLAVEDENIKAILPLAGVRSKLFGNRIISQAFSNYGGVISESQEASNLLYNYALQLITEEQYEYAEFRNIHPFVSSDILTRTDKITMHLLLCSDPDEIWNSFSPKVRNQVRKAEKSGITVSEGGTELLDDFYRVYTIRMRQLGTPGYPRSLMYKILQQFNDNSRISLVRLGNLTVGAAFTTCYNGFAEVPWAATLVEYNKLCPNNLLYWSVIKHYCLAGAKYFDFGRCTVDGPTYHFKKQWGPKPVELYYQYRVHPDHELSLASPNNPKYQRKIQIWKKLPLFLTRLLSPYISRNLP